MAVDFEALITKYAGEDGNIPSANVAKIASAISSAVGREFVAKERYNAKLDEIETLKGEKQTAEDNAQAADKLQKRLDALKAEYDGYKADTEAKAKLNDIKAAYKQLCIDEGVNPKYIDTVLRATQFDGMKLDAEGKLEKADELKTAIGKDWADFKTTTKEQGAKVETPPKPDASGANTRAAELAKAYHERRYGKAPENGASND